MSRSKVTPEQRIEAALSYLNGEGSYKFIADRYFASKASAFISEYSGMYKTIRISSRTSL